jgi:hypothetical protein
LTGSRLDQNSSPDDPKLTEMIFSLTYDHFAENICHRLTMTARLFLSPQSPNRREEQRETMMDFAEDFSAWSSDAVLYGSPLRRVP